MEKIFKVSDLKNIVAESLQGYAPKLGKNVESDNKKNSEKAYKEISKETEKMKGDTKDEKKERAKISATENKGMSDLQYDGTNDKFKENVKSQIKGYASSEVEKNHKNEELGNGEYGKDDEVKDLADTAKEKKDINMIPKTIGLTSKFLDKDAMSKMHKTAFESKKMKRLTFKNTVFLSEEHMLSRVPDSMKNEGNRFVMRDKNETEYIVEWHEGECDIEKLPNMKMVNEEMNRMKELFNYKSCENSTNTTSKMRLEENDNFKNILDKARKLSK